MLDGHIETELFTERKKTLLSERLDYERQLRELRSNPSVRLAHLEKFVELVKNAHLLYVNGNAQEKRRIIRLAVSNRSIGGKSFDFSLISALSAVAARQPDWSGAPPSLTRRTFWKEWADKLCKPEQDGLPQIDLPPRSEE